MYQINFKFEQLKIELLKLGYHHIYCNFAFTDHKFEYYLDAITNEGEHIRYVSDYSYAILTEDQFKNIINYFTMESNSSKASLTLNIESF